VTPVVRSIDGSCLLVGAVVLFRPGQAPQLLGAVAQSSGARELAGGGIAYPADGSIVTLSAVELATSGCRGTRAARGLASVQSLSLFGGAIRAQRVELGVRTGAPDGSGTISGLRIDGRPVPVVPGRRLALQGWGYAVALPRSPIFFDPTTGGRTHPGRERASAALLVHLLQPHAGLPAGTVLLVTFAGLPLERATPLDLPLKVTPPLGQARYMFPVAGRSDYVDTYGAFRGDVPGNWHHGDDIFAALGTPVVAVADGTLNRPGWDTVGGWRLWVRDSSGNEFYYAHLSGYSPQALHSEQVKAGEVIGFIGNTGDAFTTSPHLHFEIHPRSLLHLDYNGAVDPTRYLDHWQHLVRLRAPRPQHPPFPTGAARQQAGFVWRELLAARGLIRHPSRLAERALQPRGGSRDKRIGPLTARTSAQSNAAAQQRRDRSPSSMLLAPLLAATSTAGLAAVLILRLRRRRAAEAIPETL
jgi:murein DD-endopeptidase MepM/ murein hydrolase activator NlpD